MWIEIFRTGTHTDSSGKEDTFTEETLDKIAETYNSRTNDSAEYEAPLVKGHPQTDEPAYGWIERLARRGTTLMAKLKELAPELAEEIKKGMFKKVSIAVYPDLMLRHVGLLGAVPPAVKGLRNVSFAGEEFSEFEGDINYKNASYGEQLSLGFDNHSNPLMIGENVEQQPTYHPSPEKNSMDYDREIAELQYDNACLKRDIESLEKQARFKGFREYANSLIDNADGSIIKPSQADDLLDILEMAFHADKQLGEEGKFSESLSNVNKVKSFVSGMKPGFNIKEFAQKRLNGSGNYESDFRTKNVSIERLKLHEKAKELQAETPGMSYEEAVTAAQKEFRV